MAQAVPELAKYARQSWRLTSQRTVAAEWMGHSTVVADKHYWRVTEADHERAIQKAQQKRSRKRRTM